MISGHGGNVKALELAMLKVAHQYNGRRTLRISLFRGHQDAESISRRRAIFIGEPEEGQPSIHASRWETSETLADRPHLVRQKMVRPRLKMPSVPEWTWRTHELSETGVFGDPSLVKESLGEKMWATWAEAAALFLKRLWESPIEEQFPGMADQKWGGENAKV